MISLADFEGISGFKWAALVDRNGVVRLSERSPNTSPKKLGLIAQVLAQAPFKMDSADLAFNQMKVLIRRGMYGYLILFCKPKLNTAMVDIVISESLAEHANQGPAEPMPAARRVNDSTISTLLTIGGGIEPIPAPIIEELLDLYTRVLGPLARVLAQRETKKAGLTLGRMPGFEWSKLLNLLATRIENLDKREMFLDEAVLLKRKF